MEETVIAKKRMLSGIKPSGDLTLGSYLGAVKNWAERADEYECFYFMADLHAITVRQTPADLRRRTLEQLAQYIACHQAGVSKQACIDIVGIFGRLILELSHTAQLAEHGVAIQHPTQLCMLVNMALDKQGVLLRIQTAGNVLSQLLQSAAAQVSGILANGDGMQISHKVETVVLVGTLCPILNGTQVRAQGQVTGGLDAG